MRHIVIRYKEPTAQGTAYKAMVVHSRGDGIHLQTVHGTSQTDLRRYFAQGLEGMALVGHAGHERWTHDVTKEQATQKVKAWQDRATMQGFTEEVFLEEPCKDWPEAVRLKQDMEAIFGKVRDYFIAKVM